MRKRIGIIVMLCIMACLYAGCSDPKRDAVDTNILQQISEGTLSF